MSETGFNPIKSVDGYEIPVPSKYEYILSDVSASDAGRTEDTEMHKMLLGSLVKLNLEWNYISLEDASVLLNVFANEYFTVQYWDIKDNGWRESTFYVGDKTSPLYSTVVKVVESISFNLIEVKAADRGRAVSINV